MEELEKDKRGEQNTPDEDERRLHVMQRYWLWLCSVEGLGLKRMYQLLDMYEDVTEIFALAQRRDIRAFTGLGARVVENLFNTAQEGYIDALMEKLARQGVGILTRLSPDYPPLLAEIYAPPALLYVKGPMPLNPPLPIAIVGTRAPTRYGLETARSIGRQLADAGVTVVSGLARGIDGAAHEGALDGECAMPTIAVMGCGVDVPYPAGNRYIYDAIAERGAVISEYAPGVPPSPGHFPARNRIISGLSRGVVVVESGERSGTLFTVNYALEQGRDVFAVPGRISDETSRGTNRLIKEGAKLITSTQDVLEEYGLVQKRQGTTTFDISAYDYPERSILSLLQTGEKAFDELADALDISASALNSTLTSLEFRGIIKQLPGRLFFISAKP